MTAPAQPHGRMTRWATASIRALRSLNQELTGAGEAIARSNRFPQPDPAQASHAHSAPADKVLTEV
jgi:hypothetical protein